jgi:pimeloyl-ACP methyl ester carboxylesterase
MRCEPRVSWLILASALACAGIALAGAPAAEFGRLTLHRCGNVAWCGRLPRALDPSGAVAGTIAVYFEYYPHSGVGPATGTLVATEGGPGYGATDSRDQYLALFAPLRADHDVLIMDNRGTGRSGALDCPRLQNAPTRTVSDIGDCGRSLGRRAPLYSTTLAADDLAALLDALAIARIDLYGNSYGSYFAQVFALRHSGRVRSLVLDGADALGGPDFPWYPHYAPAMRAKFNLACERDPGCSRLGGSSMDHIAPALRSLREHPFAAHVRYGHGAVMRFTADASRLAIVMFGGSTAYATVRELDAAARAFVAGDRLPLLRLMAETRV